MASTEPVEWAEVSVMGVLRTKHEDPGQRQHVMLLAERDGDRKLPVWIGPAEATVLALALESVETPRPFPYKLAAGLVEAAGARVTEVRVTRLIGSVFHATVAVRGPAGRGDVDARPSDAVNLAVAAGVPILVNAELLAVPAVPDAGGAGEAAKQPVAFRLATADIAAEAQERMREQAEKRAGRAAREDSPPAAGGEEAGE